MEQPEAGGCLLLVGALGVLLLASVLPGLGILTAPVLLGLVIFRLRNLSWARRFALAVVALLTAVVAAGALPPQTKAARPRPVEQPKPPPRPEPRTPYEALLAKADDAYDRGDHAAARDAYLAALEVAGSEHVPYVVFHRAQNLSLVSGRPEYVDPAVSRVLERLDADDLRDFILHRRLPSMLWPQEPKAAEVLMSSLAAKAPARLEALDRAREEAWPLAPRGVPDMTGTTADLSTEARYQDLRYHFTSLRAAPCRRVLREVACAAPGTLYLTLYYTVARVHGGTSHARWLNEPSLLVAENQVPLVGHGQAAYGLQDGRLGLSGLEPGASRSYQAVFEIPEGAQHGPLEVVLNGSDPLVSPTVALR